MVVMLTMIVRRSVSRMETQSGPLSENQRHPIDKLQLAHNMPLVAQNFG